MSVHPLISIIVPIYNVEPYINRCINTIINQTYDNLEIILIDDGSQDNCSRICDEFAELDERIIVIHRKNGGLSAARNSGIDVASGEFIAFVDSDDYINPKMYEILLKNIVEYKADISICNFERVYDSKDFIECNSMEIDKQIILLCNRNETFEHLYDELSSTTVVAWNKLYKRDIFKTIRYPEGKIHEDEFVIHHLIKTVDKVVYTNLLLYYYFQRNNSIIGMTYNVNRLDAIDAYKHRMSFFAENAEYNLIHNACDRLLKLLAIHYGLIKKHMPNRTDLRKKIKSDFNEIFLSNKRILSKRSKIELYIFYFSPFLYRLNMKLKSMLTKYK